MDIAMNAGNPIWFLPLSSIRDRSPNGAISPDGVYGTDGNGGAVPEQGENVSKVTPFGPRPKRGEPGRNGMRDGATAGRSGKPADSEDPPRTGPDLSDPDWLENGVRALYKEVVEEPLPPDLAKLVDEIGKKKR